MNIMNEIDVDHNGKLDFSEFTVMMRDKLANEDMELEIKQAFRYVRKERKKNATYLILVFFLRLLQLRKDVCPEIGTKYSGSEINASSSFWWVKTSTIMFRETYRTFSVSY